METFRLRLWRGLEHSCSRLGRSLRQKGAREHWEECLGDLASQQRVWGPLREQGLADHTGIPFLPASADALGAERAMEQTGS